ncbi:hypothetical protein ACX3O0_08315 [Homoserinimonas sp. A447]
MSKRFAGAVTALALVSMVITGCAASPELEAEAPEATKAPSSETPTPTPTPTPFVPDCLTIISEDTLATLQAEGFVLIEEHEHKLAVEQRVETMFFDNGGVDCLWGIAGGGDSLVAFGYSEISPADAAIAQDRLAADGYLRTEEGADVILSVDPETGPMGVGDVFLFTASEWFHSTTREAVDQIRLNIEEVAR